MSYPGNPSLAPEIQERITTTFQQTLEMASQQKDQEARLGCEFILRMDPQFQPAQRLLVRLKGAGAPAAGNGGGDADLDLSSLDDLGDLEELGDLDADGDLGLGAPPPRAPAPRPAPPAAPQSGLATVVTDLMARRNFQQVLQIAESQRETVARDPRLQALIGEAQERAESEPFVTSFLADARAALDGGEPEVATRALAKARQLDAGHPGIAELEARIGGGGASAPPDLDDFAALQQASLSLRIDGEDEDDADADSFAGLLDEDPFDEPGTVTGPLDDHDSDGDDASDDPEGDEADDLLSFDADDDFLGLDDDRPAATAVAPPDDLPPLDEELPSFDLGGGDATPAFELDGEAEEDRDAPGDDDFGQLELGDDDFGRADEVPPPLPASEPRTGRIGAADDSGDRVQQLLDEGQEVYDRGEYQAAIDVWSRIFLIEIDNGEASRRIEAARNRKAELERQGEEVLHQAIDQIQAGDVDGAAATLRRVLELAPSHATARDYLEQIEAGKVPTVRKRDLAAVAGAGDIEALDDEDLLPVAESDEAGKSLEAAVARDRIVAVKKTNKTMIAAGAGLLALLVVGGIWVGTQWNDLFPNAEPVASGPQQRLDPISRATEMHESGNTENALILLRRVSPEDPQYAEALALLAQWEALVEPATDIGPTGPDEAAMATRRQLVDAATQARAAGFHRRAVSLLSRAGRISPLDSDEAAWKRQSEIALEPLRPQIALFMQGSYDEVVPELWHLHEKDPDDRDVEELLIDSYYNLTLRDLQRGNAAAAAKMAREGLSVRPDEPELQRLLLFCEAYESRSQDLLYRIFVKYLPPRG